MTKVTNISTGPRGAYLAGALVMADPGKTIDADDYSKEWFKPVRSADEPADEPEDIAAQLAAKDARIAELEEQLTALDRGEPGPLDGSVEALSAHLATVDDADEVQALIDAETAGKSRKGALAALEARRDELLAK